MSIVGHGCHGLPCFVVSHGSSTTRSSFEELLVVLCLSSLNWRQLTPEYFSKHASPEITEIDKPRKAFPKNCAVGSNEDSWMTLDQPWSMTQSSRYSTPQHQFNVQDAQCRECSKAHTSYAAGCMTVWGPFLQVQRPLLPQLTHTPYSPYDAVPSLCLRVALASIQSGDATMGWSTQCTKGPKVFKPFSHVNSHWYQGYGQILIQIRFDSSATPRS